MPYSARGRVRTPPAIRRKWGRALAESGYRPEDPLGRRTLAAVRRGLTIRQLGDELGSSPDMAAYLLRRLVERARAAAALAAGLAALEANRGRLLTDEAHRPPPGTLTRAQYDACATLLAGATEAEAAAELGISQSAVNSRKRLAARSLRSAGEGWAKPIGDALRWGAKSLRALQVHKPTKGVRRLAI